MHWALKYLDLTSAVHSCFNMLRSDQKMVAILQMTFQIHFLEKKILLLNLNYTEAGS